MNDKSTRGEVALKKANLPTTREGMLERRKTPPIRHLVDEVEQAHLGLWGENEKYELMMVAAFDEDAVTGKVRFDEVLAAEIIWEHGKAHATQFPLIANAKLVDVLKRLRTVAEKYEMTRKQLRETTRGSGED